LTGRARSARTREEGAAPLLAFLLAHRLPPAFYRRDCAAVARDLLGTILVRREGSEVTAGVIVEDEAYYGAADPASHAYRGRTRRNKPMFGPAGHAYVYFVYGNHFMLNAVCGEEGDPAAVLIRALEPAAGFGRIRRRRRRVRDRELTNGPGRLTQALGIGRAHNGLSLAGDALFVSAPYARRQGVVRTGRIGIGQRSDAALRFYLKESRYVSRR
jgi:DNA-3-methyladenine glycosylase